MRVRFFGGPLDGQWQTVRDQPQDTIAVARSAFNYALIDSALDELGVPRHFYYERARRDSDDYAAYVLAGSGIDPDEAADLVEDVMLDAETEPPC